MITWSQKASLACKYKKINFIFSCSIDSEDKEILNKYPENLISKISTVYEKFVGDVIDNIIKSKKIIRNSKLK